LTWANHAFLNGAAAANLDIARRDQVALDKSERELAAIARAQNAIQEARRFSVVGGQRRALAFNRDSAGRCRSDRGGSGHDRCDGAEAKLAAACRRPCRHARQTSDRGGDLRPRPEADLLQQGLRQTVGPLRSFLDKHPGDGEILDRLRDARKLPEQRDYQACERSRLALYQESQRDRPGEEPCICRAARPSGW